jgi:hypothetical protein
VNSAGDNSSAVVEKLGAEAQQAVQVLGKVIHSASIYGMEHRATVGSIDEAYRLCREQVAAAGRMNFAIRNDALLLGGKMADNTHALVRQLCRKMISRKITAFSIVKGMEFDEFKRLVELLSSNDHTDFDEQLRASNLTHVSSDKIHLREVAEDEEVVAAGGAASDIRDLAEQRRAGLRGRGGWRDSRRLRRRFRRPGGGPGEIRRAHEQYHAERARG